VKHTLPQSGAAIDLYNVCDSCNARADALKYAQQDRRSHLVAPDLIRTLPARFLVFYREMAEMNMTGKGISPSNNCSALLHKERK
jgi:hypothetical protein